MPKDSWFIVCPKGHRVITPRAEVHQSPDGVVVYVECDQCQFPQPLVFIASGPIIWNDDGTIAPETVRIATSDRKPS